MEALPKLLVKLPWLSTLYLGTREGTSELKTYRSGLFSFFSPKSKLISVSWLSFAPASRAAQLKSFRSFTLEVPITHPSASSLHSNTPTLFYIFPCLSLKSITFLKNLGLILRILKISFFKLTNLINDLLQGFMQQFPSIS